MIARNGIWSRRLVIDDAFSNPEDESLAAELEQDIEEFAEEHRYRAVRTVIDFLDQWLEHGPERARLEVQILLALMLVAILSSSAPAGLPRRHVVGEHSGRTMLGEHHARRAAPDPRTHRL
ncbi:MAG: hypothetical protein M3R26_00285 [Actinomycetota bacterium]|nr:hypothetical protein [Actinomycetota bacterium]MDQ2980751.1 hypothetical protein [Actinomycetota bacterium]